MKVVTIPPEPLIDKETMDMTKAWRMFFDQLVQGMQLNLSDEGFLIPVQSSDNINIIHNDSVTGTLLFNSSLVNGGTSDAPNGQLVVQLADGTFHPITNT